MWKTGRLRESETNRHFAPAVLVAAIVFIALFVSSPWGDTPFSDDFSFAWMAKSVATAGHIVFNGWSEPTVGIQAYWGALIIHLFGWSYQVLRLSMFPWSIALALMTYATARLLKLPATWAGFATLVFCLSPLLLPLETSFMTDVPSTFLVMLSTYAAARAATDERERSGLAWMAVALVSVGCGSSIRQSNLILLPVIVCVPAAFRRSRTFLLWSIGLGAVASILCAVMVGHFLSRPHTHSPRLMSAFRLSGQNLEFTFFRIFVLLASTVLFCAPMFAGALKDFKPRSWRIGLTGCAVSVLYLLATHFWLNTLTFVPYGGVITTVGVGLDETFLGGRPVVLPGRLVIFVTVLALTSLPFLIRSALAMRTSEATKGASGAWLWTHGAFSVLYFAGVVVRSSTGQAYDRYLLPVLPLFILGAGWVLSPQTKTSERRPSVLQYVLLVCYAWFGIAAVHDYYAQKRAFAATAEELISTGVKRTEISAGFDFDAATEIQAAGLISDCGNDPGPILRFNHFLSCAPSIDPRYGIGLYPVPGATELDVTSQNTRLWLPPFHAKARVFLLERPDGSK